MTRPSLCFDLDGTLIDSAVDIVGRLNEALEETGYKAIHPDIGRSFIGTGSRDLVQKTLTAQDVIPNDTTVTTVLDSYRRLYDATPLDKAALYPGARSGLMRLQDLGFDMAVCTNKPGMIARQIIDQLDLSAVFKRVIGAEDGYPTKPKPDMIFAAAGHGDAEQIVLIGDSGTDARAALAAGVRFIMVDYGYCHDDPETLNTYAIISSLEDLPPLLSRLFCNEA